MLQTKKINLSKEGGWAILSTMIAIVVGLIMLAGIFAIVNQALTGSKIQTAQQNISTVRMNMRQVFSGQSHYGNTGEDLEPLAISAQIVPSSMLQDGTSGDNITNTWNGNVDIGVDQDSTTRFYIQYEDVPQDVCVRLATYGAGQWEAVDIGDSGTDTYSTALDNDQLTVSEAEGECGKQSATSDTKVITFFSN